MTQYVNIKKSISVFIVLVMLFLLSVPVFAKSEKFGVEGKLYEFTKDSHYEFYDNNPSTSTNPSITYGTFSVGGNIKQVKTKSGTPSYKVSDGDFVFYYDYTDAKLDANADLWHLVDDKSNKVSGIELDSDIMKGTIIIQIYSNNKYWVTVKTINNAFGDVPNRTDPIYTANDIQLLNGCKYRVIVVYELARKTDDGNFLFINTDKYDYKKYAEVYKFDLFPNNGDSKADDLEQTYRLGTRVKSKEFDGYFGESLIEKGDIHYGWDLGNFFVSGYTGKVKDADEHMVFLKNVGDKVTLWFKLTQDINRLNGNDKLSIAADKEGYDQYFETARQDFGRGTLIIRHTDYNNEKIDPVIYTDYLDAYASLDAEKKITLFEEGDYEVALDYEVKKDEMIDKIGHYRIFFKFSIRNGNCMVYPFDVKTGSELTNSSVTENGFRLDLAKSRYLNITLKRETLKDSADGLVEDTRFNGVAKDGAEYTDEGIYTITVSNEYTGAVTTKKIYVGTNNILRAYVTTGYSIPEINNLIANGAEISKDGSIQLASIVSDKGNEKPSVPSQSVDPSSKENATGSTSQDVFAIVAIIVCAAVVIAWITKKTKKPAKAVDGQNDKTGGSKQ